MVNLELLASHDGHAHFAWGALIIHVWWGEMSHDSVALAGELGRQLAAHTKPTGSITIVEQGVPLPSRMAQRAGSEALEESQEWLACNAVVLEGEGFWVSAARACYSAMQFVVRHRCPQRVFRTDIDAIAWAAQHLTALGGTERSLYTALSAERERLRPGA